MHPHASRRPHVLITAGGTSEPIDDVRTVTNRSSGRFGAALANAFAASGARTTVLGSHSMLSHPSWLTPSNCNTPAGRQPSWRPQVIAIPKLVGPE